jgi:hypothetical protein
VGAFQVDSDEEEEEAEDQEETKDDEPVQATQSVAAA